MKLPLFFAAWALLVVPSLTSLAAAGPASLSLAGEWRFALDPQAEQTVRDPAPPLPEGEGIAAGWFRRELPERIQLPGVLQAQGFGNVITPETPWVVTLGDAWWKLQPAELRARFSQPGHVEVPFLSQPPRHYLGVAWYQREIEVPAAWQGQRGMLFLERPHWETTVWLDEQRLPSDRSLVAPHEVELGLLTPGRHRVTIRVDNRRLLVEPGNDGHSLDGHSVSDALGATWNGVAGRLELRATSPVWIADAQVFPRVQSRSALIRVKLGNLTGQPGSGRLSAGGKTMRVSWTAAGGEAELEVPLGADAPLWDEFHPHLHQLTLTLRGEKAEDTRPLRFGLREVSWRDKELLVNGRPTSLRTTHFGGDFPLTGFPATEVESWKRIIRTCQDYGMNGMRFHSWCPPEAAFEAADELGFYLQAELGLWAPFSQGGVYTRFLEEETPRLLRACGNHPSFLLFSPSNEPSSRYPEILPAWAASWYRQDPRRLYAAGTGWSRPEQVTGGAQFASLVALAGSPLRNESGWFGRDFRAALGEAHIPVLSHEIGQWCAFPSFKVIPKFTGYLQPGNYHIFQYLAEQGGVLPSVEDFARASGRFQLACYKEDIEANLRTPGLAGFQMLDLHDYLGQGTALIGVLDAFWESKGAVTGPEFRRFSSATVPLARLRQRTFTAAETLTAEVELYHYGARPLPAAQPYWKIVGRNGETVAQGTWPAREVPIGKNISLGRISAPLASLPAPAAYKLVVGLQETEVENDWNFWLYPAAVEDGVPAGVLLTSDWAAAEKSLAEGGRVLFTPGKDQLDPARSPKMKRVPVFWNNQMTVRPPKNPLPKFDAFLGLLCQPRHPALQEFPTEASCDWQWTALIHDVAAINLSNAPRELRPMVAAIDDWNRDWRLGVVFEGRVGPGRLLVSAIPLSGTALSTGARQLRHSLLSYAAGENFQPAVPLPPESLRALFVPARAPATPPPARAFDPDLNDGSAPRPSAE